MAQRLLAIIADDLTGALDAAAPFSAGARVAVATRVEALGAALATGASVVAVSTRSREIDADTARARIIEVLDQLPREARLFKKIDSRLQGNIAAELSPFDGPVLAMPAIPDFGRVVRDGCLAGFGVGAPISVSKAMGRTDVLVPDTKTQADVTVALKKHDVDPRPLLVGARGLAQGLAEVDGYGLPRRPDWYGPVCFAIGSTDPITLEQIDRLRATFPDLAYVAAPAGQAPAPEGSAEVTLVQITAGADRSPEQVSRSFAQTAPPHLARARTLVMSGGATAEALLDALGIDMFMVAGEALPGMPLCRASGYDIVTKSGGFGAPEDLVTLAKTAVPARQQQQEEHILGTG